MQKSLICADAGEMLSVGWATHIQDPEGFELLRKKEVPHKDNAKLSFLREL